MTREIERQSRLAGEIAATQIQVSTGKRIQRASDDPTGSARVSAIRTTQANEASWARNINLATALTSQADTALSYFENRMDIMEDGEHIPGGASTTRPPCSPCS